MGSTDFRRMTSKKYTAWMCFTLHCVTNYTR
uniref:Uncharacterized protein n=1 Tax=Anguilla anguilla TaxID=7936 RepID=A0A0E9VNX1_ANGAN